LFSPIRLFIADRIDCRLDFSRVGLCCPYLGGADS
jgi:hypothetical protein